MINQKSRNASLHPFHVGIWSRRLWAACLAKTVRSPSVSLLNLLRLVGCWFGSKWRHLYIRRRDIGRIVLGGCKRLLENLSSVSSKIPLVTILFLTSITASFMLSNFSLQISIFKIKFKILSELKLSFSFFETVMERVLITSLILSSNFSIILVCLLFSLAKGFSCNFERSCSILLSWNWIESFCCGIKLALYSKRVRSF